MLNLELGNILANIAEHYKFSPDRKNMVFPLAKTARSIRDYPADIQKAYQSGEIWEMKGIVKEAVPLIDEFFSSGSIKIYEQIKKQYPEPLIKFIRMSGLGKKRVLDMYRKLGVSDLEQLKDRLFDGRFLTGASGQKQSLFKPLHIARLKHTIEFYERMEKKSPRGFLDHFLPQILAGMQNMEEVQKVVLAGSLRRKKPMVGDMDILILPVFHNSGLDIQRSKRLLEKIGKQAYMGKKKSEKTTKHNISYCFETALQTDMEVIITTGPRFAYDWFTATGNKGHVKKVLRLLKEAGQGIEDVRTEQDIYRKANLAYVPCELREDLGEVEQAAAGKVPPLVHLEDIRGDLHIHSVFSDGLITMEDIRKRIETYSYEYVALSDHSQSNVYGNGLDPKRLMQKMDYIRRMSPKAAPARLLAGAEVDICDDGSLDYSPELLQKLDVVIASMHSKFSHGTEHNTKKAVSGLANRDVDCLAHPTGVVLDNRAPYFMDMDHIIEAAKKYNKALEINAYFLRLDLDDFHARKAKDAGVKLVINTDSHRSNNMDHIRLGVDIARRAGLGPQDIINTWPYEQILEWKKQR